MPFHILRALTLGDGFADFILKHDAVLRAAAMSVLHRMPADWMEMTSFDLFMRPKGVTRRSCGAPTTCARIGKFPATFLAPCDRL